MKRTGLHIFSRKELRYFAGFFVLLLLFFGLQYGAGYKYAPHHQVKSALKYIQKIDNQCVNTSKKVLGFLAQKNDASWEEINGYLSHYKYGMIIFRDSSPFFWNDNHFPVGKISSLQPRKPEILFSNGQPFFALKSVGNKFSVTLFVPLDKKILPYGITIKKGIFSGKNYFPDERFNVTLVSHPGTYPAIFIVLLFLLYGILILYAVFLIFLLIGKFFPRFYDRHSFLGLFLLLVLLVFFRVFQTVVGFPQIFDGSFLFKTQITGWPGFDTLGDILIDLLFFGFFLLFFSTTLYAQKQKWNRNRWFILFPAQLGILLIPVFLFLLTENILQNSGLILYPDSLYFSTTGAVRLFVLFVVNLLVYFWLNTIVDFYHRKGVTYIQMVLPLIVWAILLFLFPASSGVYSVLLLSSLLVFVLSTIFWFVRRNEKPYFHSILSILVLSLAAAFFLNINEQQNRNAHQQFTANILTQKRDPYLEYLVKNNAYDILKDKTIISLIWSDVSNKEARISRHLVNTYFHGLLSGYRKQVTLCEPGQQLEIQPENKVVGCNAFFNALKGRTVDSLPGFELSLVNNTGESIYYLARFHFNGKYPVNLYVEFYTNIIPKGLGYPELLQNHETGDLHLSGYSFAFYQHRKLAYKFGDYPYPIAFSGLENEPEKKFFNKDGFTHYILPVSKTEVLIVSRPARRLSDWLLPFSLLVILSGIFLLAYVFCKYGKQIRQTFRYSYSTRLQLTLFSALIVVYALLTAIIIYYFNANSRKTISNNLKEKTLSVSFELQRKISVLGNNLSQNRMEIQSYLQKMSLVFFSDINLYDNSGWLVVSSRPEIFSRGLQSRLINPEAYSEIEKTHKLFYLGKEKIRQVAFYSSYAPFILENGKMAGIINLPYFARQTELQHTYFQMLSNLINLFVITGLLGMLLMVYLSRLMTKPLHILQHKIESVTIEKQNEKIEWKHQDEIGKLITAYNQMVEKLEESALLLKDSAREKAWREMARQIAHEIRNPLTPMKLNVQYLQRVYGAKDPAFDEKFRKVSQSLIDQIETLNEVVNMFSDFSRTKTPTEEISDLVEPLRSTTLLFKKSYGFDLEFSTTHEKIPVQASSQDLLRIFNNLLKNAVQSMERQKEKRLEIRVKKEETYAEVRVTDNGKGIGKEDREHIFQPYFTTKSKGTGLGLAIVKNLMTEAGGDIRFVSKEGQGTTFILHFRLVTGNKL